MNILKKTILLSVSLTTLLSGLKSQENKDKKQVDAEHGMLNMTKQKSDNKTIVPGTEWFPKASLGLFIHWGLSTEKNIDLSWPMIPGRELQNQKLSDEEIAAIIKEKDYNKYNDRPKLTPNEYWSVAKDFKAENYDPYKWAKAAKAAGFTYAVFTTKHHEGFALWPTKYGNFNTKNYMGGKDLVKDFVLACRKYGLKVGFYYSPPDWYFDKEFMNFMYYKVPPAQPKFPKLDADLNPRTTTPTKEELAKHQAEFAAYVKGQITELLTNYGKIDLMWFDGAAPIPNGKNIVTIEEIRKMQPGIVINPRMHGTGDFVTFERTPPAENPGGWAEYCDTWTNSWSNSSTIPFRSNAFILGEYVLCRSWDVNFLLGVGPDSKGEMSAGVYKNMGVLQKWMDINKEAVKNIKELPKNESASVPATATNKARYLFAIPQFKPGGKYEEDMLPITDVELVLKTSHQPKSVTILGNKAKISYTYKEGTLTIKVPAKVRSKLVDVIKVVI